MEAFINDRKLDLINFKFENNLMSLAGLGLQGITVSPRFIFGVDGELRNNLHLIDEHKLLYTAGHNIVVYSTDEKNQYFL